MMAVVLWLVIISSAAPRRTTSHGQHSRGRDMTLVRMQQRRTTVAAWASANPVLAAGELGFETDGAHRLRIGNGTSVWSALPDVTPVVNVRAYGAVGDNVTDDSGAIQAAITAAQALQGGGVVYIPAGTYKVATGLTINGAVKLFGAGGVSDIDGGFGSAPQTLLNYTGSGIALSLQGVPGVGGDQGIKNIHLRDFAVLGSSAATGGILVGTGTSQQVQHSSLRNITVLGFTQVGAYGFSFRRMLTSTIDNCLAISNYDGFKFPNDCVTTTLIFHNCHAYQNTRNGLRVDGLTASQSVINNTFYNFVAESNADAGVHLDGASFMSFYNLYCEANNTVSGAAPVVLIGTTVPCLRITFYNPYMQNPVGGTLAFSFANASQCVLHYPNLEWESTGWAAVTAATANCITYTATSLAPASVTGNATGRMQVLGSASILNDEEGTWTPADGSGAALTFANVTGTFERRGRVVTARCALTYPVQADASNAIISGLPYTVANSQDARQGFVTYKTEATLTSVLPATNGTTVQPLTSAGAAITNATLSGDTIYFTVVYRV